MANDVRYYQFPIPLLKTLFTDSHATLKLIKAYGIYQYVTTTGIMSYGLERCFELVAKSLNIQNTIDELYDLYVLATQVKDSLQPGFSMAMVNVKIVEDYYNNHSSKKEFDYACFAAFAGIRSIIGIKDSVLANKSHVHARMFGKNSVKEWKVLDDQTKIYENQLQRKYLIRYHMDKVLTELQLNWHLKLNGTERRGFILSFKLSLFDLIHHDLKNKKANKVKQLAEDKKQVREQVKRYMNNPKATDK